MNQGLGSNIYLPLLRWKAAEVGALTELEPRIRQFVFPVMELCPTAFIRYKRTKGKRYEKEVLPINTLLKKLVKLKGATGDQAVGIDLIHIKDSESPYDCRSIWNLISTSQKTLNLRIVPVTGFNGKGKSYQELIGSLTKEFRDGLCVRVSLEDISRRSFTQDIDKLLSILQHEPRNIDLILDLKLVDSKTPEYATISGQIPQVTNWRSVTLLGASFPVDLTHLEANNTHELLRLEWSKWQNEVQKVGDKLVRVPMFGDYTAQHPLYREPVRNPRVSASIRYTTSDRWVVFRGEWIGKKNGSGCAQYPAWAQLLVARSDLYSGASFSYGDEYIMRKSIDGTKPGGRRDWLTVEINHHITYTVCQLHPELLRPAEKKAIPIPEVKIAAASAARNFSQ